MNKIKQILIPLFILLIASSCSTSNRINGSGYKTSNKVKKKDTERYFSRSSINESKSEEYSLSSANSTKTESTETFNEAHLTTSSDNTYSTIGNNSFSPNKRFSNNLKQEKKSLVNIKTNDEDKCDNIILRNGDEVKAKVIEVTETEVKYKRCDNLNGPIYSKSKSSIFMIQYANGTKDVFKEQQVKSKSAKETESDKSVDRINKVPDREADKVSVNSFVAALFGVSFLALGAAFNVPAFVIASIFLFVLAFILGIIGMIRVSKYPEKYKGKGFAIFGFIIGLLGIILFFTAFAAAATLV